MTFCIFQKSENPQHAAIMRMITEDSSKSLVDNYLGGLELVDDGDSEVAMLMEATAAHYVVAQVEINNLFLVVNHSFLTKSGCLAICDL